MAKPFRLQTVVRLREARRDAARAQLADAIRAAEVLGSRQQELRQRFVELNEQRRVASETADTAWLLNAGRYELVLRSDQQTLRDNREAVEREIERRRSAVAAAEQEVRALEQLRERSELAERREKQRREAKRLDEFASVRAFHDHTPSTPLT
ncbi:Flagellar FliJ protein [Planctomycetes bacterium MalM25]|nr:Flagellar FliJ protein [Planctomycetes bacterium MalM25]